jgi:cytochrome c oxidase subunit II
MSPTRRLVVTLAAIWIAAVVVGSVIFAIIPFPPQPASNVSQSISDTTRFITFAAWPIFSLVVIAIIGTVLMHRREPNATPMSAGALRGSPRMAGTWVGIVTAIVLTLAIIGTITLNNEEAAEVLGVGGRATAAGSGDVTNLEVQVIAQQWMFTYRYPSFGGFESAHLVLPVNVNVTFHVTSLDVVHSFWFPAMGVKADAVPLHDNTFITQPLLTGTYRIVCGELCGLWHGAMSDDSAQVMSSGDFATWAQQQQTADAPIMKYLPPYSHTYLPDPPTYAT